MVITLIKDYEIKLVNNEEILYVFLDFNSEFASLNNKHSNKKLKNRIKDFIESNNIQFGGITAAIIVGGVMMGTLLLNDDTVDKNNYFSNNVSKIVSIIDNKNISVKNEMVIDETIKKDIDDNIVKEIVEIEEEKSDTNDINVDKSIVINNKKHEEKNIISVNQEKIEEEQIEEDNSIYVTINRSGDSKISIELEEYILGVVAAEMPASFNIEALKAQAVVSRTYALRTLENGKFLTDNSSTQNYKSDNELKILWGSSYDVYYNKIKSAVESTKGIYLTYDGLYIDAVFHSTSNGYTEDAINVWGNNVPYLKSVQSSYDNTNRYYVMETLFTYEEISNKLSNIVNIETNFNILGRNESGRVSEIEVNGIIYSGVAFRNLIGLRSSDFEIKKMEDGINIKTKGYGHGVGMSQYGANGMANNGYSFKDILLHYYSGVKLNSI